MRHFAIHGGPEMSGRTPQSDVGLGALVSVHPVDNRGQWVTGMKALALGLLGGLALAALIAFPSVGRSFGKALGLALIPTVVGLLVAVVQLTRAVRGGRGECIELYQDGLAHLSRRRGRRSWAFSQVTLLRVTAEAASGAAAEQIPIHRLGRQLGWDLRCSVTFADGTRLRINGMAEDAPAIVAVLRARCAEALRPPDDMAGWRWGRWVLPAVVATCAGVLVLIGLYITGHDADSRSLSDSALAALAAVAIVCLGVLALALPAWIMLLMARWKRRR